MFCKEKLLEINLRSNFEEFCRGQMSCDECVLAEMCIVNIGYEQPCEQVYSLLTLIQEKG